jgi:hypothetical protein
MIRLCAWCKSVIGVTAPLNNNGEVTHGLCLACLQTLLEEAPALEKSAAAPEATAAFILAVGRGGVYFPNT